MDLAGLLPTRNKISGHQFKIVLTHLRHPYNYKLFWQLSNRSAFYIIMSSNKNTRIRKISIWQYRCIKTLKLQLWTNWLSALSEEQAHHISTVSIGSPPVVGLPGEQGSRETCVWGDPLWLMEPWFCLRRLGRCWVSLHLLHLLWNSCCTWKKRTRRRSSNCSALAKIKKALIGQAVLTSVFMKQ